MNRLTVEFHESAATLATTTNVSKNVSATIFDSCTRASPVATPQKEPSKIIEKELSSKKKLNDTTDKKKRRKKKWKVRETTVGLARYYLNQQLASNNLFSHLNRNQRTNQVVHCLPIIFSFNRREHKCWVMMLLHLNRKV